MVKSLIHSWSSTYSNLHSAMHIHPHPYLSSTIGSTPILFLYFHLHVFVEIISLLILHTYPDHLNVNLVSPVHSFFIYSSLIILVLILSLCNLSVIALSIFIFVACFLLLHVFGHCPSLYFGLVFAFYSFYKVALHSQGTWSIYINPLFIIH